MLFWMLRQVPKLKSAQREEETTARWAVAILIFNVSSWDNREDVGKG